MSQGIHLISHNIPGYGPSKGRSLYLGISGGSADVSSYSPLVNLKCFPRVTMVLMKNPVHVSKKTSLVCLASSGSQRRNPDFPRQNKQNHGFFRNKSRQNLEIDNSENHEESELLSTKNGPMLSLSSNPRFQATARPGPKEKEIVELFRKVQTLLRERTSINGEKMEISQGQDRETKQVDSLLKLLRKHSIHHGNRTNSGSSSGDFVLKQSEQNDSFDEGQNTSFFSSNTGAREKEHEGPNGSPFRRPLSNFRRKSPVPRVKYKPVYSPEDSISITSPSQYQGMTKKAVVGPDPDPVVTSDIPVEVSNEMLKLQSLETNEAYNVEVVETASSKHTDLSALKLVELRELAKSRSVRGYSKLKKGQLLELLSEKRADG